MNYTPGWVWVHYHVKTFQHELHTWLIGQHISQDDIKPQQKTVPVNDCQSAHNISVWPSVSTQLWPTDYRQENQAMYNGYCWHMRCPLPPPPLPGPPSPKRMTKEYQLAHGRWLLISAWKMISVSTQQKMTLNKHMATTNKTKQKLQKAHHRPQLPMSTWQKMIPNEYKISFPMSTWQQNDSQWAHCSKWLPSSKWQ